MVDLILDRTPFYGESGGQVGDIGKLTSSSAIIDVQDVTRPVAGLFVHRGAIQKGAVRIGDTLVAEVNEANRNHIRRHHTATHLCHMALRQVLGPHATQKGSRVDRERLRFDFSHFEPLTDEQITEIERLVAEKILENVEVSTVVTTYDEARAKGAMALFGERYEESVRMVSVSAASQELCGGTHVRRSGDIGACYIVGEFGIAAGVRRIEAVAGMRALEYAALNRNTLARAAGLLKIAPEGLLSRVESAVAKEKELHREIADLKRKLASGGQDLLENQQIICGVKVVAAKIGVGEPAALRDAADTIKAKLGSGVVCLGGDNNGKAALVVAVSEDLTAKLKAGELIKAVSEVVGGRGGGRPDFAQAGGPDVDSLERAVNLIYEVVERTLKP
jgi:alanyl-tRNA synthetase